MIEQTQFGSSQGYTGPAEFLSGLDARYELLGAPGLFKNSDQANRVLQDPEFNAAFLALGADRGLKGLGLYISGPATFVTKKPIHRMADMAGMKIRVTSSAMQMDQIRGIGATPVPMALGEVLPALQQGAIDGVMGNAPVFASAKYYSVAKYQTVTDQMMYCSIIVTSKSWFEKLPPDLQQVIVRDARKVSEGIQEYALQRIKDAEAEWVSAGGELLRLPADDQTTLMVSPKGVGEKIASGQAKESEMYQKLLGALSRNQ